LQRTHLWQIAESAKRSLNYVGIFIQNCFKIFVRKLGEIDADQLVPFAIVATVSANPLGLALTSEFLTQFVEPLAACGSPVDHQQEYTVIQFMSTCQFLFEKMSEAEKGTFPDSIN
jgi:hypothetical protein